MERSSSVKQGEIGISSLNDSATENLPRVALTYGWGFYIVKCRSRLSLEQFSAFLANIKELNAQRQSREVIDKLLDGILH